MLSSTTTARRTVSEVRERTKVSSLHFMRNFLIMSACVINHNRMILKISSLAFEDVAGMPLGTSLEFGTCQNSLETSVSPRSSHS